MVTDTREVLVVGGGIVGSCIALGLANRGVGGQVTVLEPDPTYASSSAARSAAAIRTQFNLGINVAMSRYGYDFYSAATEHLSVGGEPVDIGFEDNPYLVLAGEGAERRMREAHRRQVDHGADVELLVTEADFARVPWLRADGLSAASLGCSSEGWLEPVPTLRALRRKNESLGVRHRQGRAEELVVSGDRVVQLRLDDGTHLSPGTVVNATGARSGDLAATAGVTLPVRPRKRSAFVFRAAHPPRDFCNLVDATFAGRGIYARPYHGDFLAVTSPAPALDADTTSLEPDVDLFHDVIRPGLGRRVRGFEDIELVDAWAGHYEINTVDQNGVIGWHPEITNLALASGFSGHGFMHAPAVGRGVAELILDGDYSTLDLTPFAFERFAAGTPLDDVQPSEHRVGTAGV